MLRLEYALVVQLYVGLYVRVVTISYLTSRTIPIFCRLFVWLRTGFIYGPTSSRWISGSIWLLVATGWYRLLGTSFYDLLKGGILIELKMDSVLLLLIFRWLIHVSRGGPSFDSNVYIEYPRFVNKKYICVVHISIYVEKIIYLPLWALTWSNMPQHTSAQPNQVIEDSAVHTAAVDLVVFVTSTILVIFKIWSIGKLLSNL
jgi:hypothetical protein